MSQINLNRAPRFFSPKRHDLLSGCWILVLSLGLFFMACGGSKNTDVSTSSPDSEGEIDIDSLLSAPADMEKQNAEDAEVLRLLGITPENTNADAAKTAPAVTENKTEPAQPVMPSLEQEVERLQRELNAKNQQVTELRNSLMERDAKIQEIQQTGPPPVTRAATLRVTGGGNGVGQRYAEARNLYEQRRYAEAVSAFQAILAENDKSSYADNSQYWIGECYYGMGRYAQAIAEFEKVFTFTRSNKSDAALLKLGLCYLQMGDRQQARSEFEQLIANYPSSSYVAKARKYLARL